MLLLFFLSTLFSFSASQFTRREIMANMSYFQQYNYCYYRIANKDQFNTWHIYNDMAYTAAALGKDFYIMSSLNSIMSSQNSSGYEINA
jgi:hypothetical protein